MQTPRTRGRAWQATRARVLGLNPLCAHCERKGFVTLAQQVDHILPLHKGGTDDANNLQGLCNACHDAKSLQDMGYRPRTRFDAKGRVIW